MTRNALRDQAMLSARNPEDVLALDRAGCGSRFILVVVLAILAIIVLLQLTGGGAPSPQPGAHRVAQRRLPAALSSRVRRRRFP